VCAVAERGQRWRRCRLGIHVVREKHVARFQASKIVSDKVVVVLHPPERRRREEVAYVLRPANQTSLLVG
jgi:hypothetical protein